MKINQSQKLEIARSHVDDGVPIFELDLEVALLV
jgi:hypothetical protein